MPQPTRSDVHVNRPLTNISIAYIQRAEDFIADKVFPIVPVKKQSDRYFRYTKDWWFRAGAAKRAPGTESAGGGFHIDNTPSYFADVWAWHDDVDDQTRSNADEPIDLDRDATLFVTQVLLLRREIQWTLSFMKTGVWQGYLSGGSPVDFQPNVSPGKGFWDGANSNPMQDVDFLKKSVKSQTGMLPNTFVAADDVFFALRNNASVLDRIKYTQRGIVSEELLAALFGVQKFLVASAVINSAQEGQAFNGNFLVNNQALLVYANPAPSILQPSGGYIFSWQGLFGAGAQGNRIKSFRMEQLESDRIEGEMAFDMHLVGADLGVLLINVLATA
jgi:Phage major capsid protein E